MQRVFNCRILQFLDQLRHVYKTPELEAEVASMMQVLGIRKIPKTPLFAGDTDYTFHIPTSGPIDDPRYYQEFNQDVEGHEKLFLEENMELFLKIGYLKRVKFLGIFGKRMLPNEKKDVWQDLKEQLQLRSMNDTFGEAFATLGDHHIQKLQQMRAEGKQIDLATLMKDMVGEIITEDGGVKQNFLGSLTSEEGLKKLKKNSAGLLQGTGLEGMTRIMDLMDEKDMAMLQKEGSKFNLDDIPEHFRNMMLREQEDPSPPQEVKAEPTHPRDAFKKEQIRMAQSVLSEEMKDKMPNMSQMLEMMVRNPQKMSEMAQMVEKNLRKERTKTPFTPKKSELEQAQATFQTAKAAAKEK